MQSEPKVIANVKTMRGFISWLDKNQRAALTRAFKPKSPRHLSIAQGSVGPLICWAMKRFRIRITPQCAFQLRNYYRGYWESRQGD